MTRLDEIKKRAEAASPAIVAENAQALADGAVDINRYLCPRCVAVTEKVLLFRSELAKSKTNGGLS